MRFHPDGPWIPDALLERRDAGRVVFLCGAGVSKPAGMPDFVGLTKHVVEFFDPPDDSPVMSAFRPWLAGTSATNVPLDQIFNLLHQEYGKDEVNAIVSERLAAVPSAEDVGHEHDLIKRISSGQSGLPQIVTTNFDLLFEGGSPEEQVPRYMPPAFPDINFGSTIAGIVYLHGRLADQSSEHHSYVLSSADFGRAYLSEGWATNFIRNLLERYTVVLVGYQAEDPPVKYLLQGLNHDGQYDRSRLYAFDRGLPEEIEAKWRDRGVTAIAYADHPNLWETLEAWANRADDPRAWRSSVVALAQHDPKSLGSHERGQVAHVLRTAPGARLFAEAAPVPHAEWICVMDANVRSAKPSSGYGDDAETFDPVVAHGLDDDVSPASSGNRQIFVNDSLLVWRETDDNPSDFHRLGGRQAEGFESTPLRLSHLINWIGKSVDSPVLSWWAIRQSGLHPRLLQQLEWNLEQRTDLSDRARHIWNLIIEHHRDPRNRQWNGDWFDLKRRANSEGWTASVLREFRRISLPRIEIKRPFGLHESKPVSLPWSNIRLEDLGEFNVKFLDRHNDGLDVPDEALPEVFGIMEDQLLTASGLLSDVDKKFFRSATCYPGRNVVGKRYSDESGEALNWFIKLFDQLVKLSPALAHAKAAAWPNTDRYFFRKLKLYAFNKAAAFEADYVADALLTFDQEAFWDSGVRRELLFLLEDRWGELSVAKRDQLVDRIITGPDRPSDWSDGDFAVHRDRIAARYARYLELQGCVLNKDHSAKITVIMNGIERSCDGLARSIVTEWGSQAGFVGTDDAPDSIMNIPVSEIIARAKEDLERDFGSFTEKRPFTGLVKINPRRALAALTAAARAGDYPGEFWSAMLSELPAEVTPRLRRVFLQRLARMPYAAVYELRYALGRWLEQSLVTVLAFDIKLGWAVFDHVLNGVVRGAADSAEAGVEGAIEESGVNPRSDRTYAQAINSPLGMCAEALIDTMPRKGQKAGSLIPSQVKSRIERLFDAHTHGYEYAVSIAMRQLDWLVYIDPEWSKEHLIPKLSLGNDAFGAAWSGFLHGGRVPSPSLAEILKPRLLELFPWPSELAEERDLLEVAAQWLGYMRVFRPDEPGGLTRKEMRPLIRAMPDDTRNCLIAWLGVVGQSNDDGWTRHVIPFISGEWPRERRYRTSTSMRAWIGLLDDTGDNFPEVYESLKKFLVPVETNDHPFYRFIRHGDGEEPITVRFPEQTLDLIDRATPQALARPSYELPKLLALIAEVDPRLTADQRYRRLMDLIERS